MTTSAATRTTCPYCGVGCGVLATPDGTGGATIAGDPEHPANFGRLCSKGSALGETLGLETRLLHPMIGQARVTWDTALDRVASEFTRIAGAYGPDAVAFYLSGQLLTEDYYVPNKLMKGFIGSANVDTNSRLCMASSVAGHKRVFGADTVPGCYEDLDEADLLVLVGSNAAWCHPILYQRMVKAQETRGATLVNIDPRTTATAETAALNLSVAPGQDGTLFSGLLVYLADRGALDEAFIAAHTTGFPEALATARALAPDIATTAERTGLPAANVERFFTLFASTQRVVTLYSQGVNQSAQGTDKVVAILNCHLATGRIGKPGMGPFSLTGQPNAMGGREVGGLANQLAAHMGFEPADVDRVRRFWNAPNMATREGAKAVAMFDAVAEGRIKALWIMGTNPAVSLPRADAVRRGLAKLECFVVSENVASNDTLNAGAHVRLPAAAWGEKDGTVTNSERRISRQRAFLPPPGEARPDWWAVAAVAKRMGFSGFDYDEPAQIFAEHAALSAFENDGRRDFDLGGLSGMTAEAYDAMAPTQWPRAAGAAHSKDRFFAAGGFFTASGKAQFQSIEAPRLAESVSEKFPLLLNTGRVRDHWHTMTRTGLSPRLSSHVDEPFVALHPDDAGKNDLADGGLARVTSEHGTAVLRVVMTWGQQCGAVFAPIHWNDETASAARIDALVHPIVDRYSGQPDAKATPVTVSPVYFARQGFLLTRSRLPLPRDAYWAWEAVQGGYAAKFETDDCNEAIIALLMRNAAPGAEVAQLADKNRGLLRFALIEEDRLAAAFFVGRSLTPADAAEGPGPLKWSVLRSAFSAERLDVATRRLLLSGKDTSGAKNEGPTVCACFGIPRDRIAAAIADGATTPIEIGRRLKAGTNCGSCVPELKKLIQMTPAGIRVPEPVA